jgi:hypothetical protein
VVRSGGSGLAPQPSQTSSARPWTRFPLALLIGTLGIVLYPVCLRIVSPAAWHALRTPLVRVLGARRLLPNLNNSPPPV